jgi:Glycosyl hydrolase family 76
VLLATPDPRARDRCEQVWGVLGEAVGVDARGRVLVLDGPQGRAATLWPYSQALHAAVLVAHLRGSVEPALSFATGLGPYRLGAAFQPTRSPLPARRFVDDNAWVGLAASQLALLSSNGRPGRATALRLLDWTSRQQAPSGGVRWREGSRGLHACSTGAVGVLALRAPDAPAHAVEVARRCADYLLGPLRRPDGLVGDHVRAGTHDPTVWSYNQGLAVGLLTLLHRRGAPSALASAQELAHLTVEHFGAHDRLWREPPCFVGVLGRMLLLLHSTDGDRRWVAVVDDYLERVWDRTGSHAFTGAGIGAYDRERSLDLAGLTILTAMRAAPAGELELAC